MRRIACILATLALLVIAGCGSQAERNETRDDIRRFREARAIEYQQAKRDLARFVEEHKLRAKELPYDIEHFLEWRRREWWNLTDEMAAVLVYERERVERLFEGAARFYGYNIQNFPRLPEDFARFCDRGEVEWVGLARDVVSFIEFKDREWLPLRAELLDAYARLDWEGSSLQTDLTSFLQWRDREGSKLSKGFSDMMETERKQREVLRDDIRRFRVARALEARYLVVDMSAWWHYEVRAMPPRLIDDAWRWASISDYEWIQLRKDVERFGEGLETDTVKLIADLKRFSSLDVDRIPLLAAEVDDFFRVYEREWGPLAAGMQRWWRSNVALGVVARDDMQRFFLEHAGEEAAELQGALRRFYNYSGKEWKDFKAALARFFYDDSARAFGSTSFPMGGDTGTIGFDDPRGYPARGYDAGETAE